VIRAIHGFLGERADWDFLRAPLAAIGQTLDVVDLFAPDANRGTVSIEEWGRTFAHQTAAAGEPATVLGYSLGGRLALHALLASPRTFRAAIIISAGLGVEGEQARAARCSADEVWAKRFESESWPAVVDAWDRQAVFGGRESRLKRIESTFDRQALALALRRWSPAVQTPLAARLHELTMPLLWIAGADDARYVAEAERAVALLPHAELWIAPGAGHRVPWETAAAFTARVAAFLRNIS
jgi:2-succinyl-6-hydroxy-2,4-cyclohexadiene-1-carboxylate synthase